MKFEQKTVVSFELCLTANEAEYANAVAAAAGIGVMDLLVTLLDSSLTCAHEELLQLTERAEELDIDADGDDIPSIDNIGRT